MISNYISKKILIVDDHPLIADGIKMLIERNTDFEVLNIIYSWESLWKELTETIDILILDLNIKGKNSTQIIDDIKSLQPNLKILIFSSYNKPSLVRKTFEKGVDGYVLKDTDEKELIRALYEILENKQFVGSRVAVPKKDISKKSNGFNDIFSKQASLSKREKEVMSLIVDGLNNQAISERLFISKYTVQSHRKTIFKKMEVHSVAELIKLIYNL